MFYIFSFLLIVYRCGKHRHVSFPVLLRKIRYFHTKFNLHNIGVWFVCVNCRRLRLFNNYFVCVIGIWEKWQWKICKKKNNVKSKRKICAILGCSNYINRTKKRKHPSYKAIINLLPFILPHPLPRKLDTKYMYTKQHHT